MAAVAISIGYVCESRDPENLKETDEREKKSNEMLKSRLVYEEKRIPYESSTTRVLNKIYVHIYANVCNNFASITRSPLK